MTWFFSIRSKLFALVFFASLVLVATTYWQIGSKSEAVAESVIERSLTQSSIILNTRIESRFRFIQEIALGVARDARVLPLVAEQESLTLQDLSSEYQDIYDFDILFFLNSQGTILARSDQPDAIGVNLAGRSSLFDDALGGSLSRSFIVSSGRLMQTVAAPVFDNIAQDLVKGVVVLAYELSSETAQEIVALTESQIGFFVFSRDDQRIVNGVSKSYMTDNALAEQVTGYFSDSNDKWRDVLDAESDDFRREFEIDGHIQHSVFRRINGKDGNRLGFVVAMRSDQALKAPFEEIQKQLLIAGTACLLFASIIAGLMAVGLSRPILRLVEITKQIQSGMYPAKPKLRSAKDEVGLLEHALIRMGQSLREKAELESYLAELADEISSDDSIRVDALDLEHADQSSDAATQVNNENSAEAEGNDRTIIRSRQPEQTPQGPATTPATKQKILDKRYRILSPLGSGAMGSVYLATDIDLDEKIAVKIIKKEYLSQIEGLNIKEEIRLARQITHRNIVRTFDFGALKKVYYITMEYVPGYDLGTLIEKKGALDLQIGIAICKQICSAMIAAHQMGIIHRDLKPSNMMINRQGIIKIMDFGLAMKVDTSQSGGTQRETIMGTPRYMAPEQFLSTTQLDERTDVYAIGIIMFTIFNGQPPYSAKDFVDLAQQHQHDPIPELTGKNANLIPELREIIHQALAKLPDHRFQSVKEIFDRLNQL